MPRAGATQHRRLVGRPAHAVGALTVAFSTLTKDELNAVLAAPLPNLSQLVLDGLQVGQGLTARQSIDATRSRARSQVVDDSSMALVKSSYPRLVSLRFGARGTRRPGPEAPAACSLSGCPAVTAAAIERLGGPTLVQLDLAYTQVRVHAKLSRVGYPSTRSRRSRTRPWRGSAKRRRTSQRSRSTAVSESLTRRWRRSACMGACRSWTWAGRVE